MISITWSWKSTQLPRLSLRHIILLCFLRVIVLMWQKAVFLSPRICQSILDLRAQNYSSWLRIVVYSKDNSFSREIKKAEGLTTNAFWRPSILARIFLFLTNKFLKTSLFQLEARVLKDEMAWFGEQSQASSTTWQNPRWLSHIFSKRKGLSSWELKLSESLRSRGKWSELILGRWVTLASRKRRFQAGLAQQWSNHCWIKSETSLQFV